MTHFTRYELLKMARAAGLEEEFVVDPLSEQRFRLFAQIAVAIEQPAQQPDLLEALKIIASTDSVDAALDPQRALRIARAALAKATGENT
jgi:hypothetical protein